MAYRNYYRVVLSNDFLGVSKEISAPTRYELDAKVENQKRIWDERVKREIAKQNKEEMKRKAEQLTKNDEKKIESYKNIINKRNIQKSKKYYDSLIDKSEFRKFESKLKRDTIEEIKEELNVPKKSWIEIFSTNRKNFRIKKEEEANAELLKRNDEYNKKLKEEREEYDRQKEKFLKEQ